MTRIFAQTRLIFIFSTIIILKLTPSAYSQLDMEMVGGFDNYHKNGSWLPLRLILTGSHNISGKLLWDVYSGETGSRYIFSKSAQVFTSANTKEYLYVFPETFRRNIGISFLDNKGKEISQKEITLKTLSQEDRLILMVSSSAGGMEFLKDIPSSQDSYEAQGKSRGTYISYPTLEYLPDSWKGYESVDIVILGDVFISDFSDTQKMALENWVYDGGKLIVSSGPYSQRLMGSFIEKLLPVSITGTAILNSLDFLSQRYGHYIVKSGLVVASSRPVDKTTNVIFKAGDIPIIAEKQNGYGKTIFLAFDFLDPLIRTWEGKKDLWDEILPEQLKYEQVDNKEIGNILKATSYKGPLSYKSVGLLLLLYFLCLGPLNYLIFRYTNNINLIWFIIPILTIVFIILTLGFVLYKVKSESVIVNDLSVVDFYEDLGRAKISSYFGLFSPTNRDYVLSFPQVDAIFIKSIPLKDNNIGQSRLYELVEDDIFQMRISTPKSLSPPLLQGEAYVNLDGNVSIDLAEDPESNRSGIVISDMPFDMNDCYIFSNGYYSYIGNLPQNKEVNVKTSLDASISSGKMSREKQRFFNSVRQRLATRIKGTGIIGWVDESALKELAGMTMNMEYKAIGAMLIIIHI